MTNKELLEIIKLAKENKIKAETLRRLLKRMEKNGEIRPKQTAQLKELVKDPAINDQGLLTIFEKSYQRKKLLWSDIRALNMHMMLKEYLQVQDFPEKVWEIILAEISSLPASIEIEKIYLKWLKDVTADLLIEELKFYHNIFNASLNSTLIYEDKYFATLLDHNQRLNIRQEIFSILKQNLFNLLQENISILNVNEKAQKIIYCYKQYGRELSSLYATVITCIADIEVPVITDEQEYAIYINLYKTMCLTCQNELNASNWLNSFYYKIATNKEIDPRKRLIFITSLNEKRLVLKNLFVERLWVVYEKKGINAMLSLKYALLNKGVRTNPWCRKFLLKEEDAKVISLAQQTFRKNRVRKDKEGLIELNEQESMEKKISLLYLLEEKYPDETKEKMMKEKERLALEKELMKTYDAFFKKKAGMEKLTKYLEWSKPREFGLTRVRKQSARNGI